MSETVLIAAGGTGGHIYPALAMADAFRAQRPDVVVEFVGTPSGLENKLVPAQGFKVHHLPIGRLNNVSMVERVFTLAKLPVALLKSFLLLRKIKPSFVLGVGGYASGPLLLVASLTGYRTAIWEPNAMPGLTNRWLARFVDECWVVFEDAKSFLKNRHAFSAGMPVRKEIEALAPRTGAAVPPFRILVFGGSQGARGVNTAVAEMLKTADAQWLSGVRFVHQTGAADHKRVCELYGDRLGQLPVEVKEYLHDMAAQYSNADLVVCRSGTGTLSELAACGLPAILIPFPFASDDHQKKNAESLVDKQAATMILHQDLSAQSLRAKIDELRADPNRLKRMGERIRSFHQPRAAQTLVNEFLQRMDHAAG
jgi:UDP-N-acetylglucosamine--N-acetylmuramyl-(pentapeptide) pyrophosphoryl-undecaprenol N-acetylglucosamine transferase